MSEKSIQVLGTTEEVALSVVNGFSSYVIDEHSPPTVDEAAENQNRTNAIRRLIRKLDWRLMPFFALVEFCSYLNRINLGDVRLTSFQTDLNVSASESLWIVSIFYVAYLAFAIPSVILQRYLRPTPHLSLSLIAMGSFAMCMAFAKNVKTVLVFRFLLGVAESGVFPGVMIYLSFWYRKRDQALRMAIFLAAAVGAGTASGLLGYAIIQMNGIAGLQNWRWIILLESLPVIPIGIITFFFLASIPETVRWLDHCERTLLTSILREDEGMANSEPSRNTRMSWRQVWYAFVDWRIYLYCLICLGISVNFISLSIFLPSLIEAIELSTAKSLLMVASPFAFTWICVLVVGYSSSHHNEHTFHLICPLCITLLGFILMATLANQGIVAVYISTHLAICGTFPSYIMILSWLTNNVGGRTKRAISVGFVIGIGQIGGIVTRLVYRDVDYPTYRRGNIINAGVVTGALIFTVVLRICLAWENRRRDSLSQEEYQQEAAVEEPCDWHPEVRYEL